MKLILLVFTGLVLGLLLGAALGVGAGLVWVSLAHTSNFEGYSGMLVFLTFMPVGALLGGIAGALGLGLIAVRDGRPRIHRDP
ncbi:MAG: hypothetical protein AB1586_14275 [Pseudomonadota bacterium]|jgi:hypothetical protein